MSVNSTDKRINQINPLNPKASCYIGQYNILVNITDFSGISI